MMLSSVGARLYWMGRYVERVESSARLIRVYSELFLDLPRGAGVGWRAILDISGAYEAFHSSGGDPDDARSIIAFLLTAEAHAGSLTNALSHARENARTTRDVIPMEAWRVLNELYLTCAERLPQALEQQSRNQILADIVQRCQLLTGLIGGTMSHGDGYQMLRVGWHLERADMTTRVIDVAASMLMTRDEELERFDNSLWMAVLKSLSAYQMYRQYVRRRVKSDAVISYLLTDAQFPRAVSYSLHEVASAINALPRSRQPATTCAAIIKMHQGLQPAELDTKALHEYIDKLQLELLKLARDIDTTWFAPAEVA